MMRRLLDGVAQPLEGGMKRNGSSLEWRDDIAYDPFFAHVDDKGHNAPPAAPAPPTTPVRAALPAADFSSPNVLAALPPMTPSSKKKKRRRKGLAAPPAATGLIGAAALNGMIARLYQAKVVADSWIDASSKGGKSKGSTPKPGAYFGTRRAVTHPLTPPP